MLLNLVWVLLVVLLPAGLVAHWVVWPEQRRARWMGLGVLAIAALLRLPWGQGVGLETGKLVAGLLAVATLVFCVLWASKVRWLLERRSRLGVLLALALMATINYSNYGAFHGYGTRAFVHLHDVAHNFVAAKYRNELGYSDLYTALLRAEAELYENRFRAIEARDLATYEMVHIRQLLQKSDPVKARFSEQRWSDFKEDVRYFRDRLTQDHWARILRDHGFNPTPVWAVIGGAIANRVPAGSGAGILLFALLDPLLLLIAFGVIARTFGLEVMLLSAIQFCVMFGAGFSWTGGSFLRFLWFAALMVGLCALHRRRPLAAGVGLALATALRAFPVFFLVPLGLKAVALVWIRYRRSGRIGLPRFYWHLFASLAVSGLLLGAATVVTETGADRLSSWKDFSANMARHVENVAPNVVGLTDALVINRGDQAKLTQTELNEWKERRFRIYRAQRWLVLLPLVVLVAWLVRRRTDLAAAALALPLLYAGLNLAAYYYPILMVLVWVHRRWPHRLAMIFALEAATLVVVAFEQRDALQYADRGLLLALLLIALELDRWRLVRRQRAMEVAT